MPRKPLFSFKTGVARCCASGNDNRAGLVGYLRSNDFKQTRSAVMLESRYVAHYHLGTKIFGLFLHGIGNGKAIGMRHAWIVVNLGC